MNVLLDVVAALAPATEPEDVCHIIGRGAAQVVPEARVVTSYLDVESQRFRLADALGLERFLDPVSRLIGGDPLDLGCRSADLPPELAELFADGRLHRFAGGLHEISGGRLPQSAAKAVERLLDVTAVYVVGLAWEGSHYGGITLLLPAGDGWGTTGAAALDGRAAVVEAIARQGSIALQRAHSLRAQRRAEERLRDTAECLRGAADRLRGALEATVAAMGTIMLTRDPYTDAHHRRVTALASAVADRLGMAQEQLDAVRLASGIHDIGKVGIPAEILSRPGPLNEPELDLVKRHPEVGCEILRGIEFPWPLADIVLQHHERLDGSGYPRGLRGEQVIPEARVLAVADVAEAMMSHRPYRPAHSREAAMEHLRSKSGVLYDPAAVEACASVLEDPDFSLPD